MFRVPSRFHSDALETVLEQSSCLQIRQIHIQKALSTRPGNLVVSLLPSYPFPRDILSPQMLLHILGW